jgi:DNA invertase Pin-like site-specific DNA recombinase
LTSERTLDGLEAARARGHEPKLSERQVGWLRQMHASGEPTVSAIAETFSVTRPTIYRVLDSDIDDPGALTASA